ncbi:MAG: hypothetical protein WD669_01355 [Pirellulales bacterium]
MPINVTCPGCLTRFTVGEKFAGKKGPCPKCKAEITIPKPSEAVIIHAPEHSEAGAIGVGGRHALKTYKRLDTKFKPLVFTGVAGFVLLAILIALVIRIEKLPAEMWLMALAAVVLGPPSAWAGYTFLRDDELEGYRGHALVLRAVICGLVYALLWGVYWFVGTQWGGPDAFTNGLEIFQLAVLFAIPLAIGTFAAYVSLDLDLGSGFFHCGMYFAITVLLRLVAGMPPLPGLVIG